MLVKVLMLKYFFSPIAVLNISEPPEFQLPLMFMGRVYLAPVSVLYMVALLMLLRVWL